MGKGSLEGSDIYRSVQEVSPGVYAAVVTIQVAGFKTESGAEDASFTLALGGARQFRRVLRTL